MGRGSSSSSSSAAGRYEKLGMAAALSRPCDYPTACGELAAVLRLAYKQLPKGIQSIVIRDALLAFRLLPGVQTGYGVSSANLLLQAAEMALPKQKKALAVSEFKHSVVAHKRRAKAQQEKVSWTGSLQLPHDVLVHVFSFLDMRSLVAVGLVCWAWNSAANDSSLWRIHYSLFFHTSDVSCYYISGPQQALQSGNGLVPGRSINTVVQEPSFSWKKAFQQKHAGYSSLRCRSNRAICRHCGSTIWLSNLTCATPHYCCKVGKDEVKIRPVVPDKVVNYVLGDNDLAASSDDVSDSDELTCHEHRLARLWAYPRLLG